MLKAKFVCNTIEKQEGYEGPGKVSLTPVVEGSEENKTFSKYTPAGLLELWIDNPSAEGFFEEGGEYLLDINKSE